MTLNPSLKSTYLPELASGPIRFEELGGLTIEEFGLALAPANLSARQAKEVGLLTSGICGHMPTTSLHSADLTKSLVSKLQARTASLGSTLYKLTWKQRPMPSGRLISALRASVRRTSDNALIGWPTTQARDGGHGGGSIGRAMGEGRHGSNLDDFVMLAGWHTPVVRDYRDSAGTEENHNPRDLPRSAPLAGWPTTRALDGSNNARPLSGAKNEAKRKGWNNDLGGGGGGGVLAPGRPGPTNGFWRNVDWLGCRDDKWRPVEPGSFPLAHGATNRVGRLRGYGNAIVAPLAEEFLRAALT